MARLQSWPIVLLSFIVSASLTAASATIKGPPIAEKKELKKIARLGEDVRLICPMSGHPVPLIDWTKDKEAITSYGWVRFKLAKKSLKIKDVTKEDTGIYVCKGTNGFGSEEIRIDLIVIDPLEFPQLGENDLPDVAPPVLTEETKSLRSAYRKPHGDDFRLFCEALGKPEPEIVWYKEHMPIPGMGGPGRHVLSIKRVSPSDSGLYTCEARNLVGVATKNFTLDVTPPERETMTSGDIGIVDNQHFPILPNGPENTTVEQGGRAVLECKVQSATAPNVKWLKRLESWEYVEYQDSSDIIDLGPEKFRVIHQPHGGDLPVLSDSNEYVNKLVIPEADANDSGMYYCFIKKPVGYKFKNAYLTVMPKSVTPVGGLESGPILIVVICLSVFVLLLLATITVCVVKKKQKQAPSSTLSESPDVHENLMRQHNQQQQQPQQQQQHLHQAQVPINPYQQQYQQQQHMYQQHQQQSGTNNNHRHMNIIVNKMEQPLPPPPPPPPSLLNEQLWGGPSLYSGSSQVQQQNLNTTSNTDNSGSHHSGGYSTQHYHPQANSVIQSEYSQQQQQNQYEVPHAPPSVRYGPVYGMDSGTNSIYPYTRSQQHVHY